MRRWSWLAALLFCGAAAAAPGPRVVEIPLEPHTRLTIDIVPDLGTRLIFPFSLDAGDSAAPFHMESTNRAFASSQPEGHRNTLVVMLGSEVLDPAALQAAEGQLVSPQMYGYLFITVGGYQITVLLRGTFDTRNAVSDVVFTLTGEQKRDWLQQAVASETDALRRQFAEQRRELELQGRQQVLAGIARLISSAPSASGLYEEESFALTSGRLRAEVIERLEWTDTAAFRFELAYGGREPLAVHRVGLQVRRGERWQEVASGGHWPAQLTDDQRVPAALLIPQRDLVAGAQGYALVITTDQGEARLEW